MNKLEHQIKYIYWSKESIAVHLTQEEFSEKIKSLEGYTRINYTTSRTPYRDKVYAIKKKHNYLTLYMREDNKYIRYTTNWFDSDKVQSRGSNAIHLVFNKFSELTHTTMKSAFGTVGEEFKRCIPKQFTYQNTRYFDRQIRASSIDACSHYPASMSGRLPDSHTAMSVRGTVEPNAEYPFAFYIKSGHCAEYGVFDTHDWYSYDKSLWTSLFRLSKTDEYRHETIKRDEDITILMKSASYSLFDTFNYYYQNKEKCDSDSKEYQDAKLVMNASIGMMHQKNYKNYRYAHLVAIALCRANQKILDTITNIGLVKIVQVCVDGIIYLGDKKYGSDTKALGKYYQEFTGITGKVSSLNRYIFMSDDNVIKFKTQCMNRTKDNTEITLESIHSLDDQYTWWKYDPLKELKNEKVQSKQKKGKKSICNL